MASSERPGKTPAAHGVASVIVAGAGMGLALGWLNAVAFAWAFPHTFATPTTLLFWGGSVAFWYFFGAAAGSAVLAGVWSLFDKRGIEDGRAVRFAVLAVLFAVAWFWAALWLNFAVLGAPRDITGAKLAANGALLLGLAVAFVACVRREGAPVAGRVPATATLAVAAVTALAYGGSFLTAQAKQVPDAGPAAATVSDAEPPGPPVNVILLTVDTLRADRLGLYGHVRDTSPFLDSLAEQSVVFEHAFSAKTNTSPSVASFLTGEYPHSHGIHNTGQVLADGAVTLAERLSAAGYTTAGIVTNGNLVELYNFNQGFDEYVHGRNTADGMTDLAIDWLDNSRRAPFFLWVHYIDPHSPYSPPSPYDERYVGDEHYEPGPALPTPLPALFDGSPGPPDGSDPTVGWYLAQYDGEIRFTDDQLARLYDRIEEFGLLENTLIVLTSDHGENFGEDDYYGHGLAPHDAGIHVPLLFRLPGASGRGARSRAFASGVDVVPTILEVVGLPQDPAIDGRSLVPDFRDGDGADSFAMVEAGFGPHIGPGLQQVLRVPGWKYVQRDTAWATRVISPTDIVWLWNAAMEGGLDPDELYDMEADPHETRNLIDDGHARAAAMRAMVAAELERIGPRAPDAHAPSKKELEAQQPDLVDELRELGYMD